MIEEVNEMNMNNSENSPENSADLEAGFEWGYDWDGDETDLNNGLCARCKAPLVLVSDEGHPLYYEVKKYVCSNRDRQPGDPKWCLVRWHHYFDFYADRTEDHWERF